MKRPLLIAGLLFIFSICTFAQSDREIPYSQSDRDRSIRMEERQNTLDTKIEALRLEMNAKFKTVDRRFESMEKSVDKRFDSIDKRFSVLENLMYVIIAGIYGLIGFVAYDRRKANEPFKKELKRERQELEKLRVEVEKNVKLREALKKVPSLQEVLKHVGLL